MPPLKIDIIFDIFCITLIGFSAVFILILVLMFCFFIIQHICSIYGFSDEVYQLFWKNIISIKKNEKSKSFK